MMDASFCARSQTLSLVYVNSLLPSHSSFSPVSCLRSLDFPVNARIFKPPDFRYRRKCRNLLFRFHSPRFMIKASLHSQSHLILATITISAFAVVMFVRCQSKKINISEVARDMFIMTFENLRVMINQIIGKKGSGSLDLERDMQCTGEKYAMKEIEGTKEIGDAITTEAKGNEHAYYEDEAMRTQPKGTDCAREEEESIKNVSEFPATDNYSVLRQSEVTELLQPLAFDGVPNSSQLPVEADETTPTTLSVPIGNAKAIHEIGKVDEIMGNNCLSRESCREGLYTFFEVEQLGGKDALGMNTLEKLSPQSSVKNSSSFSSPGRKSTNDGRTKTIDVLKSKRKDENLFGNLNLMENREFLNDNEGANQYRDDQKLTELPSCPNGIPVTHVNTKHYISQQISSYKQLLKNGRLSECIELLEDLERKGLLNMEKIHHAEFFRKCKIEKAVKEAFHFTRLIPSPTLSTFNMLMNVCACSQNSTGAFEVLHFVQVAGLKPDCKLYTTLISACARSGKVDEMFKVFHEMVNAGVEPNVHTYGALIDGCAKAGQVAKAFGAYGILRSKNVEPDRVVFNALITACGQSGAVHRAFDVLADMKAETHPIDPDHVTVGALIKACMDSGQLHRVREVYNMIHEYNIKGTPEVYTIAVHSCSLTGDCEFACSVYNDMKINGIVPDEMFLSALVDVMGHANNLDAAFEILEEARKQGIHMGIILYSSLMGACSNAKNCQKALELYKDIKSMGLKLTVSTMNALITALCDGDQVQKALEVLFEIKKTGLSPNIITYSVLLAACEKEDNLEAGLMLFSQAKNDGVTPSLVMSRCLIAMCLRRFKKAGALGESVMSFNLGRPQVDSRWTSIALLVYRETITAGISPDMELFSQVLGCLKLPTGGGLRDKLIENLQVSGGSSRRSNLCSLVDGFGEYDPRALSLFEEAVSLGIIPCVSVKESPIIKIDARELHIHTTEVYILTILKSLKHRLAAGAKLPNISILLPVEKTRILSPTGEKEIRLAGRISQSVAASMRRLGLTYIGSESNGKVRINGVVVKKWLRPKLDSPFNLKQQMELGSTQSRILGKGISHQQRSIRTGDLSFN
ncbi:pentatricopeptide repeat-containing protein MRL1, chloroplastic-like [Impatiens glandulifera]|uniref:pentatricopeptide repeat-containing protein MRL1, chloroplastic-like n=1 Tax=Impatiens glandulifera TaxID=253017 RepID=UPI001FB153F8|nr:pentatricopeptide repeat-containing protein MRL1, chloroplastic-like [Impatiens glandulifera]